MALPAEVDFDDVGQYLGQSFGPSPWLLVDQGLIDAFAAVSGDFAWYHTDVERAAAEMPDGKTTAHGLLTLSLLPRLSNDVLRLRFRSRAVHYGVDRVRFATPVQVGDSIRVHVTPTGLSEHAKGRLLRIHNMVETASSSRPALVADRLILDLRQGV
jgi:acyl dehydratase